MISASGIGVSWQGDQNQACAEKWAQDLNIPLICEAQSLDVGGSSIPFYQLNVSDERLELWVRTNRTTSKLCVDFVKGTLGYRRRHGGGLKQLIARAVGLKHPREKVTIFDATAGLGKDAFILAALGCHVRMFERSKIIAALLKDGLTRAALELTLTPIIQRMSLIQEDARTILSALSKVEMPDVIYLDPMFPLDRKRALNKIEMRMLRDIVGGDSDGESLLWVALQTPCRRVVVKRLIGDLPIGGIAPSFVVEGQSNRYDVYMKADDMIDR